VLEIRKRVRFSIDAWEAEGGRGIAELQFTSIGRHLAFEINATIGVALLFPLCGKIRGGEAQEESGEREAEESRIH